ncbi:MAG: 16S rRNA (cytidine(1402)-2'-O)-methyltransferase [Anaerolineaceae bacterium]
MKAPGQLYIVATPIGHPKDITLRAIEILQACDAVICEEMREGTTLLKSLGIADKEFILLNEHNEAEQTAEILLRLYNGQDLALISDCGTPVFADPGHYLVRQATQSGVRVAPIPGPSSLMAALSVLDFEIKQFVFGGFLSRDPDARRQELTRLRGLGMPVVLLDTPYRLASLLQDVSKVFGKNIPVTLAADLTMPNEKILRGPVSDLLNQQLGKKSEFILIVHNSR